MSAVTERGGIVSWISCSACLAPYQNEKSTRHDRPRGASPRARAPRRAPSAERRAPRPRPSSEPPRDVALRARVPRRREDRAPWAPPSTSSPFSMNAVQSETRAACCMLCVTMTTVMSFRSSYTSSSTFCVLSGSSDAVGSSSSSTSGSSRARARCRAAAAGRRRARWRSSRSRSFTSSQSAARRSACSTIASTSPRAGLSGRPAREARGDVVADGHRREGRRPLEDHPDVLAAPRSGFTPRGVDVAAVEEHLPARRARRGTVSCIRLRQRSNVDLPHPDGPMIAVTRRSSRSSDTSRTACTLPEPGVERLDRDARACGRRAGGGLPGRDDERRPPRRAQSPLPAPYRARVANRASMLMTRTRAMRTRAPAQARECHSS